MFNLIKKTNNRGVMLIDILVASVIFIIIAAAILSIYVTGTDMWDIARHKTDLQAQARQALNSMVAELRNATRVSTQIPSPNLVIPAPPDNNSITFCLPEDNDGDGFITDSNGSIEWGTTNPIIYQYIPAQKVLKRIDAGQESTLANDVSSVQFIDITIDSQLFLNELKIILVLNKSTPKQRDITVTASTMINLRN
jgi:type II secretory pathway pseudopilin PulG